MGTTRKHKHYKALKELLESNQYYISEADIERDIIVAQRLDGDYALLFYYGGSSSPFWLADEEKFNDEEPLWFSEQTHELSPAYVLREYVRSSTKWNRSRMVVVMMDGAVVINAEDMVEIWDDMQIKVISMSRLIALAAQGQTLDFETDHEDIDSSPKSRGDNNSSSEEDEDETSDAEEEDWDEVLESLNKEIANSGDDDGDELITIKEVRFCMRGNSEPSLSASSHRTYFRPLELDVLSIWVDIEGSPNPDFSYSFELRSRADNLIAMDSCRFRDTSIELVRLKLTSVPAGEYWLYIRRKGKELYSQKLTFVAIDGDLSDSIILEAFGLYRVEQSDDEDWNYSQIMLRGPKSCFDCEGLAGVLSVPILSNVGDKDLPYQYVTTVEDEDGKIVFEEEEHGELEPRESTNSATEIRGAVCAMGNYTLRVELLGEVVASCGFVVGHLDVTNTSKVGQFQSPLNKSSKGVVREKMKNPMEQLESMTGLTKLKKQIKRLTAKIQMDNLRHKQGLPTKAQQLHMAFLGNPGTGKTTVAKLLGQIYKEIGVLRKGHVVVEDRSTLMTQHWGGEGEMVNKALERAQGGILFIDEAYDLITEHKADPGQLIISALLAAMADETNRDFMVIFAGYTLPMESLLSKNPGLRSRLTPLYFEDYNAEELIQIGEGWMARNCYTMTADARRYFEMVVTSAYASRGENFGNARYVVNLLENEIQPAMAERVMEQETLFAPLGLLTTIEACDIPNYHSEGEGAEDAVAKLDKMVGLSSLKGEIRSHLSYIRFVQARRRNQIETSIPPLHMIFTGNPGTGKTSVAEYLGEIYRSMGILSVGNVIKVTRADIIDGQVGGTEQKMKNLLTAAHGNILFVDEAYTLFSKGDNDTGKNAIEVLLDTLGKEQIDMIVVMAGYPKQMEELLTINPGLKGRFPYIFNFEDYSEEELFEIAQGTVERNNLTLTAGAAEALRAVIRRECKSKDSDFSNARFVVRLLTTQVLPNMARRLEGETDSAKLRRVLQRDIPIEHRHIKMINENLFDEWAIELALKRLDSMVGLAKVKAAIHQFVDFARVLNRKDPTQIERHPLKWSFVGNTGTGKSSVAEILSEILKAMHLLGRGHTVEVKAEELYGVATYKADELIQRRMREALQGLLFVDGDAPQFRSDESNFSPDYLRMCLAINTNEIHGRFAVVIAEHDSPRIGLAKSLSQIGISNFDHTLIFDDYSVAELCKILDGCLLKVGLSMNTAASEIMSGYIGRLHSSHGSLYANARTMKELASTIHRIAEIDGSCSGTVTAEMVSQFATSTPTKRRIGY